MPTGVTYCQSSNEFTASELAEALNGDFGSKITSGDIIVNDGTSNLSPANGINWIRTASRKYIDDGDTAIAAAFAASDSTIMDEVDRIEAGAGLATDGQYIPRTTSNYIDAATSLRQESTILDAQLKTTNDSITSLAGDMTTGLDLKVDRAGDTMTGTLNMGSNEVLSLHSEPSSMNTLVNKAWVLTMMKGVAPKAHVRVATINPLPKVCTYDNGSSGVGATLTADTTGSLSPFDGAVLQVGDGILLAGQPDSTENGVYVVTVVGDVGVNFVLTRREDTDGSPDSECLPGSTVPVNAGNTWAGYMFYMLGTSQVPRRVGIDTITWG